MGIGIGLSNVFGNIKQNAYLLRDEFTTDLTAGNIDETLCEPGPGTRKVVDTNNYLALSSGVVTTTDSTATAGRRRRGRS